jgi:hypothetical protein|nr:MAG TPA: adenylate kinase [Caudoviricetes sp.]
MGGLTMTKYIECKAVFALIRPDDPNDERCAVTVATAKRLIRHALAVAPAADVAPVTRCKDCKYAYINSFAVSSGEALCTLSGKPMQQDDFCSYGEPKEG